MEANEKGRDKMMVEENIWVSPRFPFHNPHPWCPHLPTVDDSLRSKDCLPRHHGMLTRFCAFCALNSSSFMPQYRLDIWNLMSSGPDSLIRKYNQLVL